MYKHGDIVNLESTVIALEQDLVTLRETGACDFNYGSPARFFNPTTEKARNSI